MIPQIFDASLAGRVDITGVCRLVVSDHEVAFDNLFLARGEGHRLLGTEFDPPLSVWPWLQTPNRWHRVQAWAVAASDYAVLVQFGRSQALRQV
ncbi:hypothetical protein DEI92_02605 [Curtobacterium sp. MCBD17_034]|nr:hypothetical protein DEI92_02605 [Curtobacterium sp. MCBD17_034]PZM39895.1 hypothetical protein DEI90_03500 [Curtobacterium sp. MCBD17_031]